MACAEQNSTLGARVVLLLLKGLLKRGTSENPISWFLFGGNGEGNRAVGRFRSHQRIRKRHRQIQGFFFFSFYKSPIVFVVQLFLINFLWSTFQTMHGGTYGGSSTKEEGEQGQEQEQEIIDGTEENVQNPTQK